MCKQCTDHGNIKARQHGMEKFLTNFRVPSSDLYMYGKQIMLKSITAQRNR
jgi:hypothetical protein